MKKTLLIGIAALSMVAAAGVGVRLAFDAEPAVEVKADTNYREYAGYTANDVLYLETKSAWDSACDGFAIYYWDSTNSSAHNGWSGLLVNRTYDWRYEFVFPAELTWTADRLIAVGYTKDAGGTGTSWDHKAGQTQDLTPTKTTNCIWLNNSIGGDGGLCGYDESVTYQLTVGATTQKLYRNNASEMKGTFAASAGDAVSLKVSGVAEEITPSTLPSNNLSSTKKIKTAGSVTFYINTGSGHSTWAEGYKPSSIKLQNFCDYLLQNSISESTCAAPTGDVLTNLTQMWNGTYEADANYALGDEERAAFKAVGPRFGDSVSYASVVEEAMTRYCHLVSKYSMSDFAGVLAAAGHVANPSNANNSNGTVAIVVTIVAFSLLATLGFVFVSKKRRQN